MPAQKRIHPHAPSEPTFASFNRAITKVAKNFKSPAAHPHPFTALISCPIQKPATAPAPPSKSTTKTNATPAPPVPRTRPPAETPAPIPPPPPTKSPPESTLASAGSWPAILFRVRRPHRVFSRAQRQQQFRPRLARPARHDERRPPVPPLHNLQTQKRRIEFQRLAPRFDRLGFPLCLDHRRLRLHLRLHLRKSRLRRLLLRHHFRLDGSLQLRRQIYVFDHDIFHP